MTRSRRSSRYLGTVTRAQLDRAARYDVPARPTTDEDIAALPILDLADWEKDSEG